MGGCISAIVVSVLVTVIVSLVTTKVKSEDDVTQEWEKTITIDNPLNPWKKLYAEELAKFPPTARIDVHLMSKVFKHARYIAYIGGVTCIILFIIAFPAIVLSFEVLTYDQFKSWLQFCFIICMVATVFVVVAPPVEEIVQICRTYREKRKHKHMTDLNGLDNNSFQLNTKF